MSRYESPTQLHYETAVSAHSPAEILVPMVPRINAQLHLNQPLHPMVPLVMAALNIFWVGSSVGSTTPSCGPNQCDFSSESYPLRPLVVDIQFVEDWNAQFS